MYGQCEQYGKSNLLKRLTSLLQRKQGFITIGIPISKCDLSEEEM